MLSAFQFFRFGLEHLDLVQQLADAGKDFVAADSFVERWEILKPLGDALAPVADDLAAMLADSPTPRSADEEAAAEAALLAALNGDGARGRDGQWLRLAFDMLKIALPLLISVKPS